MLHSSNQIRIGRGGRAQASARGEEAHRRGAQEGHGGRGRGMHAFICVYICLSVFFSVSLCFCVYLCIRAFVWRGAPRTRARHACLYLCLYMFKGIVFEFEIVFVCIFVCVFVYNYRINTKEKISTYRIFFIITAQEATRRGAQKMARGGKTRNIFSWNCCFNYYLFKS